MAQDEGHLTTRAGPVETPRWISEHVRVWAAKKVLRDYYAAEIFGRVCRHLHGGRVLELGSGPGFFARHVLGHQRGMVTMDICPTPGLSVTADVHRLPFADASFVSVTGVDVLHHFESPGRALKEIARVLQKGGRLVLVEPWTGAAGTLFYRYVHHEDCYALADPWLSAFSVGKSPMDGNAWIPKAVLVDARERLKARTGLDLTVCETFGGVAYLLTGGFQPFGAPAWAVRATASLENRLPARVRDFLSLRVLYVAERV